jgi:hypothetical protein
MKKGITLTFFIIMFSIAGCKKAPMVKEERTVLLADPSYLKVYKQQCERQRGTFCAKIIDDDKSVAANLYSNKITTTEYLLTCTKPKQTPPSEPECVYIK